MPYICHSHTDLSVVVPYDFQVQNILLRTYNHCVGTFGTLGSPINSLRFIRVWTLDRSFYIKVPFILFPNRACAYLSPWHSAPLYFPILNVRHPSCVKVSFLSILDSWEWETLDAWFISDNLTFCLTFHYNRLQPHECFFHRSFPFSLLVNSPYDLV